MNLLPPKDEGNFGIALLQKQMPTVDNSAALKKPKPPLTYHNTSVRKRERPKGWQQTLATITTNSHPEVTFLST
jgi:hypothetical protein